MCKTVSVSSLSVMFALFRALSCRVGAVEISIVTVIIIIIIIITEMLTRKQPSATPTRTAPL